MKLDRNYIALLADQHQGLFKAADLIAAGGLNAGKSRHEKKPGCRQSGNKPIGAIWELG